MGRRCRGTVQGVIILVQRRWGGDAGRQCRGAQREAARCSRKGCSAAGLQKRRTAQAEPPATSTWKHTYLRPSLPRWKPSLRGRPVLRCCLRHGGVAHVESPGSHALDVCARHTPSVRWQKNCTARLLAACGTEKLCRGRKISLPVTWRLTARVCRPLSISHPVDCSGPS